MKARSFKVEHSTTTTTTKGSSAWLEGEAVHGRGQPERRRVRRELVRHPVSALPREVSDRGVAARAAKARRLSNQGRPGPHRGQHERAHHAQDLRSVHDREGARPHQAHVAQCAVRAGGARARGRHGVRYHQDRHARAQQGALRQAPPAPHRTQRLDAQGHRAPHLVLHARPGQHGERTRTVQGPRPVSPHRRGHHAQHPSHLQHQVAHDQAGAGQRPQVAQRVVGPLLAQVQVEEHQQAQEAAQDTRQGRLHALPARATAQQARQGARERRLLQEARGREAEERQAQHVGEQARVDEAQAGRDQRRRRWYLGTAIAQIQEGQTKLNNNQQQQPQNTNGTIIQINV